MLYTTDLAGVESNFNSTRMNGLAGKDVLNKSLRQLASGLVLLLDNGHVEARVNVTTMGSWHSRLIVTKKPTA